MVDVSKDADVAYILRMGLEGHKTRRWYYRHCV